LWRIPLQAGRWESNAAASLAKKYLQLVALALAEEPAAEEEFLQFIL